MRFRRDIAPTAAFVGDFVTVSFAVKNQGTNAAPGPWYDSIYLSDTPTLTASARRIDTLPRPGQGLIISKRFYDRLGGHRADHADPERDLLRRIGRRRLVTLDSGVSSAS